MNAVGLSVLALVTCYVFGSLPFGLLVGWAKGIDVREKGSGNIGATNVGRAIGKSYGFLVFVLDFLKGYGPVMLIRLYGNQSGEPFWLHDLPVLCALAAIVGHVFPVWLRFKGGKAGAIGLGVSAVLSHWSMVIALGVFVGTLLITRYVSLGTILGAVSYATTCLVLVAIESSPVGREHIALSLFSLAAVALLITRHKGNIQRLLVGSEPRVPTFTWRTHHE